MPIFQPEVELQDPEQRAGQQAERLKELLERLARADSPYWRAKLGGTQHQWTIVVSVVFAIVYLWLLRQAWRGRTRFALCAGLFCLSVSWLTPWYAAWPLALAAIEEDAAGTLLALALTGYLLWDALPL